MTQTITSAELARHNTRHDLWIAVHGKVYHLSTFANDHPGGVEILTESAGTDGTESYDYAGHSEGAKETLERYLVGTLEGCTSSTEVRTPTKVGGSLAPTGSRRMRIGPLKSPMMWVSVLSLCGIFVLVKFRLEIESLAPFMPGFQSSNTSLWAGGLVVVMMACIGAAIIHREFAKTLEHTKEPFAYPAVIPRAVRLPN